MIIRRGRETKRVNKPKEDKLKKDKPKEDKVNYDEMTWNELRTYIADNEIDVGGNTKKADILAYLKEE